MASKQEIRPGSFADAVVETPQLITFFDDSLGAVKQVQVPGNEIWKLNYLFIRLSCTATVGFRRLLIEVEDANGNLIERIRVRAEQAASSDRDYRFISNIVSETSFQSDKIYTAIPGDVYLDSGYTLKLSDENVIDAAADQMIIAFQASRVVV